MKLKNCSKTLVCLNLPHEEKFLQSIETQTLEQLPDYSFGVRHTTKRLPGSLTILAGETVEVDPDVVRSRDVKAALDRGTLRLIQQ